MTVTDEQRRASSTKEWRKSLLREVLRSGGLTQYDILQIMHDLSATALEDVTSGGVTDAAQEMFGPIPGISMDNYPVFVQDDHGVWVSAWAYVPNTKLGISKPLPDYLRGKVWLVARVIGSRHDTLSGSGKRAKYCRTINSVFWGAAEEHNMTDAIYRFENRHGEDQEYHVQADTAEQALALLAHYKWNSGAATFDYIEAASDDKSGFSLMVRA